MRYLLDTAPWINGVTLPEVLPQRIRRLLASNERKGLCTISLLEAAILHRLGRLDIEGTLLQLFEAGLSSDVQLAQLPQFGARKYFSRRSGRKNPARLLKTDRGFSENRV